jgi:lipopolysaccharide transport system ATP-binding protein
MEAIRRLCTRAILLNEGKLVIDGVTDEVIGRYLGESKTRAGEQIWTDMSQAPGDNVVRLHAARVLDKNGAVCTSFDVRDPVTIELEYRVLEEGHHLVVHLVFTNEMGHIIFISKDTLDSPWRDTICPTGYLRSQCHIPGDFLNEGQVSVYCAITTVGTVNFGHLDEQDLVRFNVSDGMDPGGVRGNYPLYWSSGGVRPRLHWNVERIA